MGRPRKKAPVVKGYAPDIQDACVKRIAECQDVIDHLKTCPAWEVIKRDCEREKKTIDDNWWKLPEGSKELQEFRITVLAYMHLLGLVEKYETDLENAKKELHKLQNVETEVIKDYDPH